MLVGRRSHAAAASTNNCGIMSPGLNMRLEKRTHSLRLLVSQ